MMGSHVELVSETCESPSKRGFSVVKRKILENEKDHSPDWLMPEKLYTSA